MKAVHRRRRVEKRAVGRRDRKGLRDEVMPVMVDDGDEELYVGSGFLYNDTLLYICIQLAFLFVKILLVIRYICFFFLGFVLVAFVLVGGQNFS